MHAIHYFGMSQEQINIVKNLYNKYNVYSNNYDIKETYAFTNEYEFFAVMAQVFSGMIYRPDTSGRITYITLKKNLPDLQTFLESIFNINPNHALKAICANCYLDLLCYIDIVE